MRLLWFSSGVASLGVQLELQCAVRLRTIKVKSSSVGTYTGAEYSMSGSGL